MSKIETLNSWCAGEGAWREQTVKGLGSLPGQVETLTEQVETLTGKVEALTGQVEALVGQIEALAGQIEALTRMVGELPQRPQPPQAPRNRPVRSWWETLNLFLWVLAVVMAAALVTDMFRVAVKSVQTSQPDHPARPSKQNGDGGRPRR